MNDNIKNFIHFMDLRTSLNFSQEQPNIAIVRSINFYRPMTSVIGFFDKRKNIIVNY